MESKLAWMIVERKYGGKEKVVLVGFLIALLKDLSASLGFEGFTKRRQEWDVFLLRSERTERAATLTYVGIKKNI